MGTPYVGSSPFDFVDKEIAYATANPSGTTIQVMGCTVTLNGGTATAAAVANTNKITKKARMRYLVNTAATSAVAGLRTSTNLFRERGWRLKIVGGPATGQATATSRFFMGVRPSANATDTEPSALLNTIGIGWDSADTNAQIIYNDGSGSASKLDLGGSFPVPTTDDSVLYELELYAKPSDTSVYYRVREIVTGATAEGLLTTSIPNSTTVLSMGMYASVGGTSSVIGITFVDLYMECVG